MIINIMKLSQYLSPAVLSLVFSLVFSAAGMAEAQTSILPIEASTSEISTSETSTNEIAKAPILLAETEFLKAQSLMNQGRYQESHDLAESLNTAEGYALASESLARLVMLGEVNKLKKTSKLARTQAEKALELNPALQNARLQYVITDGFVARLTGNVSAWMKKLPQKSYQKIEDYRADFPNDVRGDALLGAWHLAIVRKAGAENAQDWFGANVAEGQALYEQALAVSPSDPILLLNYAFALTVLDSSDFDQPERIAELLQQCSELNPADDLGKKLVVHAVMAKDLFENKEAFRTYAERFLDGELTR